MKLSPGSSHRGPHSQLQLKTEADPQMRPSIRWLRIDFHATPRFDATACDFTLIISTRGSVDAIGWRGICQFVLELCTTILHLAISLLALLQPRRVQAEPQSDSCLPARLCSKVLPAMCTPISRATCECVIHFISNGIRSLLSFARPDVHTLALSAIARKRIYCTR